MKLFPLQENFSFNRKQPSPYNPNNSNRSSQWDAVMHAFSTISTQVCIKSTQSYSCSRKFKEKHFFPLADISASLSSVWFFIIKKHSALTLPCYVVSMGFLHSAIASPSFHRIQPCSWLFPFALPSFGCTILIDLTAERSDVLGGVNPIDSMWFRRF